MDALNLYAAQKPDPSKSNLIWIVAGLVGVILLLAIIVAFFLIRYVYLFLFFLSLPFFLVSLLFFSVFFPRTIKQTLLQPAPRKEFKLTVLYCGFQVVESGWFEGTGFQSLSVELGFWFPRVSRNPGPLSCIPDSRAQDSGLHKQTSPGFWIPYSHTWGEDCRS